MKTLTVNGFDMAYLEIGQGKPLLCVHGSLNDFRAWAPVLKPLSTERRLIAPSLRHYFPDSCAGTEATFTMAQHVADVIAFIEALDAGPVDLIGHSRGGHLAFRLALQRPDLVDRLVLAEPGGALDDTLMPKTEGEGGPAAGTRAHVAQSAEKIAAGDLEGGCAPSSKGSTVRVPGTGCRLPTVRCARTMRPPCWPR
jgi:pimeloyl-ACP methyl ester carboxylesterase